MKKSAIITCFLLILQYSHGQKKESLLLNAYQANSTTKIKEFFTIWNLKSKQAATKVNLTTNDTVQNIYGVFKSFYDSIGSAKLEINTAKYFLIPDNISYEFVDTLIKERFFNGSFLYTAQGSLDYLPGNKIYTLTSFYPTLNASLGKTLSLTKTYNEVLKSFLGNKKYYDYYNGQYPGASFKTISIISKSQKESRKRREFLGKHIHLQYEDYERFWQFYSVPFVSKIIFDKEFKNALIDYQTKDIGGLAYFKKISNNWSLIELKQIFVID